MVTDQSGGVIIDAFLAGHAFTACAADKITQVKADARKSKFKWFLGGSVTMEIIQVLVTKTL